MHAMTLVGHLPKCSDYASSFDISNVAEHNLALETIKRSSVLVRVDLFVQLSALKESVSVDKEGEFKMP
jgi:hypothetical protein